MHGRKVRFFVNCKQEGLALRRVAALSGWSEKAPEAQADAAVFRRELEKLGWIEKGGPEYFLSMTQCGHKLAATGHYIIDPVEVYHREAVAPYS